MKFGLIHFYKPTPVKVRKIGDTLLGISTFVAGYAITAGYKEIAIAGLVAGVIGKYLTSMFTDDNSDKDAEVSK
jgi:hypothetical protein